MQIQLNTINILPTQGNIGLFYHNMFKVFGFIYITNYAFNIIVLLPFVFSYFNVSQGGSVGSLDRMTAYVLVALIEARKAGKNARVKVNRVQALY